MRRKFAAPGIIGLLLALAFVDVAAGKDCQKAGDENGTPVVVCFVKGRVTGINYFNRTCARSGGVWRAVPIPCE